MKNAAWENVEIMAKRVGRRIDQIFLPLANQLRKRKEKEHFLGLDLKKLIIIARNNVNVVLRPRTMNSPICRRMFGAAAVLG